MSHGHEGAPPVVANVFGSNSVAVGGLAFATANLRRAAFRAQTSTASTAEAAQKELEEQTRRHLVESILDLSGRVGPRAAAALADSLAVNTWVTSLDLSCCAELGFGPSGARAIASMLVHNETLTRLNLRHSGIGDRGARALVFRIEID